MAQLLRDSK